MSTSILNTIKDLLGPSSEHTAFDSEIIIHINTALMRLRQLGVGPQKGYSIKDGKETWADYLGEEEANLEAVKTYIYLKVRLVFDPPSSSFVLESINKQILELEFSLNIEADKPVEEGGTTDGE